MKKNCSSSNNIWYYIISPSSSLGRLADSKQETSKERPSFCDHHIFCLKPLIASHISSQLYSLIPSCCSSHWLIDQLIDLLFDYWLIDYGCLNSRLMDRSIDWSMDTTFFSCPSRNNWVSRRTSVWPQRRVGWATWRPYIAPPTPKTRSFGAIRCYWLITWRNCKDRSDFTWSNFQGRFHLMKWIVLYQSVGRSVVWVGGMLVIMSDTRFWWNFATDFIRGAYECILLHCNLWSWRASKRPGTTL